MSNKKRKDYPRRELSHDSHPTDKWIQNIFLGWFDPCPLNYDYNPISHTDGLKIDWRFHTFVNPPYSDPLPWVRKAIREQAKGNTVVLLLKHDSSTKWYSLLHEAGANFMMINGRLKYGNTKTAAFPSMLAVLTGHEPNPILKGVTEFGECE
jgi:choline dehydrogenase-like flavoprotein